MGGIPFTGQMVTPPPRPAQSVAEGSLARRYGPHRQLDPASRVFLRQKLAAGLPVEYIP